jgi:hypothetical protein
MPTSHVTPIVSESSIQRPMSVRALSFPHGRAELPTTLDHARTGAPTISGNEFVENDMRRPKSVGGVRASSLNPDPSLPERIRLRVQGGAIAIEVAAWFSNDRVWVTPGFSARASIGTELWLASLRPAVVENPGSQTPATDGRNRAVQRSGRACVRPARCLSHSLRSDLRHGRTSAPFRPATRTRSSQAGVRKLSEGQRHRYLVA